jgi:hypothetical protein
MDNKKYIHLDANRGDPLTADMLIDMDNKGYEFISCCQIFSRDHQAYMIRYYFRRTNEA